VHDRCGSAGFCVLKYFFSSQANSLFKETKAKHFASRLDTIGREHGKARHL
jgi:hypothetical protein